MAKNPYFKLALFLSLLAVGSPAFAQGQEQSCPEIRASFEPSGSQTMADHLVDRSERVSNANQFDGISTTFGPFGFEIFDVLDVVAEVREIGTTTWLLDSTASFAKGPDAADTFSVTFSQVYANTYEYRVRGKRTHERSTALAKGTGLSLDALSQELKKIAFVLQEMRRDVDNVDGSAAQDAAFAAQASAQTAVQSATTASDSATIAAASASELSGHIAGLKWKPSVRAASIANLTLSGLQTVDGVALVADDRILVKNQTAAEENGIYTVAAGAWSRVTDSDTWDEIVAAVTVVEEGTGNGDTIWVCSATKGGTLETTAIGWTEKLTVGVAASADTNFTGNITFANGLTLPVQVTVPQNFTFDNPGGSTEMQINKAGSGFLARLWGLANGVRRWAFDLGDATAEGGPDPNSGSDAALKAYADDGSFLYDVVKFRRHNRQALFYGEITSVNNQPLAFENGAMFAAGTVTPNGNVVAKAGIYIHVGGGVGNTVWFKEDGILDATGWVAQ